MSGDRSPGRADPSRRQLSRTWTSVRRWLFGHGRVATVTGVHTIHGAAEACLVVSLAGSIFFSVSPDAARPRVLLFLTLTLAPFVIVAPLLDPVVRRLRGGLTGTVMLTFALRAVLAVAIAQNLRNLLLFPLVFATLVVAKSYTISRNACLPSLVDDVDELVGANARLSRTATMSGALAALAAVGLYSGVSPKASLGLAAGLYVLGAIVASRLGRVASPDPADEQIALVELDQPDVTHAVVDMMALRAAAGFAVFQFGFSLRSAGEPAWVLGGLLAGNSLGSFLGTFVAPWIRRRRDERSMFTVALLAAATGALIGGFFFGRITLIAAITLLGGCVSVGRRAMDATIQQQAPDARTAGAYARIETRLEVAWVVAAVVAVAIRVASWVGVLLLAAFLAAAAIAHIVRTSRQRVVAASAVPLQFRLLRRAEILASHGFHDEALVIASAALELPPSLPHGPELERSARSTIDRLHALGLHVPEPPAPEGRAVEPPCCEPLIDLTRNDLTCDDPALGDGCDEVRHDGPHAGTG